MGWGIKFLWLWDLIKILEKEAGPGGLLFISIRYENTVRDGVKRIIRERVRSF